MKKYCVYCVTILLNLFFITFAKTTLANKLQSEQPTENTQPDRFILTPLSEQLFTVPTANHLKKGVVIINFDSRLFFLPDLAPGKVDDEDTAVNFNTGFTWGISDKLQLSMQFQHVDSSSPARQGNFTAERTEDNEAAVEIKHRLWQNQNKTQSLSGVISASWGTRGFRFIGEGKKVEINNRNLFFSIGIPFTSKLGERWQFTMSPTIAFFNDKNASFFHRLPIDNWSEFGTTFGFTGGLSYKLNPRIFLWSDLFLPLTGNNSISRESGKPDKTIVYNAGLRYLINPRLALDLYASNTFGSFAPLSLTGDRDLMAFGTNLKFMPDLFSSNQQYSDRLSSQSFSTPTTDGLAFFDGGVVAQQRFLLNIQGGSKGILTALRYGFLEDFEGSIYLDYIFGDVDESEQGIGAKIRLLSQTKRSPVTLSLATTVGITNQPFLNFLENDPDFFSDSNLDKEIPLFTPGGDDIEEGKQLIVTIALPIHHQFENNTAIWLTPIVGYVQRKGTELAGFNLGGSLDLSKEFSVLGEIGTNFVGEGNGFDDRSLNDLIPWNVALRWMGSNSQKNSIQPQIELYLTNRVGSSTWHQLRVLDGGEIAIGIGLQLPFGGIR